MGIPRLLDYLNRRYLHLTKRVTANELLQYHNFYIDMNFLIHNSVRNAQYPNELTNINTVTESDIFEHVLNSVETLLRLIQPSKLFFMSMDGVAPHAKWNKQRQRRFRDAHHHENNMKFDSNCISPGTQFMERLELTLKEFIMTKIDTDKYWRNCEIILSGSNTPGEGSYKIIEYMRYLKSKDDYHYEIKNCIFSGDTDLLMLGLATHDPYLSLLRNIKSNDVSFEYDIKHEFNLIHIEVLRKYIEIEFSVCDDNMNFKLDIDKLADDWILLCFLIGNDFLPNLPNFHVTSDIMPIIFKLYKQILPTLDGYINDGGILNLKRFETFINALKEIDIDIYKNQCQIKLNCESIRVPFAHVHLNEIKSADCELNKKRVEMPEGVDLKSFAIAKTNYYNEKMTSDTNYDLTKHTEHYITAIQWNLTYYFDEIPSWDWFYPYNYAPYVSDFTKFQNMKIYFDVSQPVLPLEHLLAILPSTSVNLLPNSYKSIVKNELNKFYPSEFDYDLNGKLFEWESLVILPFIDKDLLLTEAKKYNLGFTVDEITRNCPKPIIRYEYIQIDEDHIVDKRFIFRKELINEKKKIPASINRSHTFNESNQHFMYLNNLKYSMNLVKFDQFKKTEHFIIDIHNETDTLSTELLPIANDLLNKIVYVNWPQMREAKVLAIRTATHNYCWSDINQTIIETAISDLSAEFKINSEYLQNQATKLGLNIGKVNMIAFVATLKHEKYMFNAKASEFQLIKIWNEEHLQPCAIQTIVKDVTIGFKHTPQIILAQNVFEKGSIVFIMGNRLHYGRKATIVNNCGLDSNERVSVYVHLDFEPDLSAAKQIYLNETLITENITYKDSINAAISVGIHNKLFARITSNVFVNILEKRNGDAIETQPRVNLGLQLKPRDKPFDPEYVKNNTTGWYYSQKTIDLVKEYVQKFPRIFQIMNSTNTISSTDFAENNRENGKTYVDNIKKWISEQSHLKLSKRKTSTKSVSQSTIQEIIAVVDSQEIKSSPDIVKLQMKWQHLYIPNLNNIFVVPDELSKYELFDRIVIVRGGYPVSAGSKGTVVAIQKRINSFESDVTDENLYLMDILMDKSYTITSSICKFKENRIFRVRSTTMLMNITNGKRLKPMN